MRRSILVLVIGWVVVGLAPLAAQGALGNVSAATTAPYLFDEPTATTGCVVWAVGTREPVVGPARGVTASSVSCVYDDSSKLARTKARLGDAGSAPNTAAGLGDDLVRFDPQWASRQLAGQNLPGSTGWARTPGGRTLSVHAAERTFLGGPGRAPINPGLIDDILGQGTRISYSGVNDTIRIGAPNLCGRCYVVVDAQNANHIVTVMVPK